MLELLYLSLFSLPELTIRFFDLGPIKDRKLQRRFATFRRCAGYRVLPVGIAYLEVTKGPGKAEYSNPDGFCSLFAYPVARILRILKNTHISS